MSVRREALIPEHIIGRIFNALYFDEWTGSRDGRPSMWTKNLIKAFGCRIALHKFVRGDDEGCLLWGGYVEEMSDGFERVVPPFHVGLVRPKLNHRIARLLNKRSSGTLWIRGPKTHDVSVEGCK